MKRKIEDCPCTSYFQYEGQEFFVLAEEFQDHFKNGHVKVRRMLPKGDIAVPFGTMVIPNFLTPAEIVLKEMMGK